MKKHFFFLPVILFSFCLQGVLAHNHLESVMLSNKKHKSSALLAAPTVDFVNTCDQLANGYLLASFTSDSTPSFSWKINDVLLTSDTSFLDSGELSGLQNGDFVEVFITNSSGSDSASITINCPIKLNLRFFLEGYYQGGSQMDTVLLNQGSTGNANITDEVTIELHAHSSPYTLAASTYAHVTTDGYAVGYFPGITNRYLYIVVKHRNTVQTWSAAAELLTLVGNNTYDFTTDDSQAYGNNMVDVGSGVWAFYTGDINQDELVDPTDYSIWEGDNNNFASGWYASDLNGDGYVDLTDYSIWEANSNNFVSSVHP